MSGYACTGCVVLTVVLRQLRRTNCGGSQEARTNTAAKKEQTQQQRTNRRKAGEREKESKDEYWKRKFGVRRQQLRNL